MDSNITKKEIRDLKEDIDNKRDNLHLLATRDKTVCSFLSNGWIIAEDNPNSRQCVLKREWTLGNYLLAFFLLTLYIIPGIIYIVSKINKKKIINY